MKAPIKSLFLALMATTTLSSLSAQAVTISTVGSFNDPVSISNQYLFDRTYNQDNATSGLQTIPVNAGSPTNSIAYYGWGIDVRDSFLTHQTIQSHFWFNGAGSVAGGPAASVPLGTAFSLGTFTYTNEQTILSGGIVNIDFQMAINIDGLLLQPLEYRLAIDNTTNYPLAAYDTATIIGTPSNVLFMLNDTQYMLTFNGFSRDGGATFETVANLAEGSQTSAQIYATITAVPVPAAIWLMSSGLLALFGFARTKK